MIFTANIGGRGGGNSGHGAILDTWENSGQRLINKQIFKFLKNIFFILFEVINTSINDVCLFLLIYFISIK